MAFRLTEKDYEDIFRYLVLKSYPNDASKNQKRILRRRAKEHYKIRSGKLLYSARGKTKALDRGRSSRDWKIVVKTKEERRKVLESCHSGSGGQPYFIASYLVNT